MSLSEFLKLMMRTVEGCLFCGREIPAGGTACEKCSGGLINCLPPDHRAGGVLHVYKYQGPVREILMKYKYDDRPRCSFFIAQQMVELLEAENVRADIVTFVPVHGKRKRERGYDQSEMLAANISKISGMKFKTLLERTRNTASQFSLSVEARKRNVEGAFSVAERHDSEGKTILLIDDIYTTGATMAECVKALYQKAEVIPFVFAKEYLE